MEAHQGIIQSSEDVEEGLRNLEEIVGSLGDKEKRIGGERRQFLIMF